ncbi:MULTISPECIES: hypothetical protein [Aliivibrio]|jgi:hypothetical protein|uniref:Uncharacterized protein n=3 Tax=Aliivibrio TaxID=511678 RepID=A0A1B9P149_ALILO|nr:MULTISPECIES: hypothetical protein [Aliivibrio]AZL84522.1 hypothetical protein EIJ81_07780 [Aliivibrio salmonicida]OCH22086.1 hypothetical protein A6E04_09550 [Aliivibrio logei]OEF19532.1 hypothetical protein A1Q5_18140 [Aliivibrio logei 5S-186]CAQ78888.1 hypothetical protein VSAL_I1203 [Aliivibrio salmonicida LFI1238]
MMKDYELFIKINDAILLEFDIFKAWEKSLLLNAQNQLMDRFPISEPQRELLTKVLNKKRPKKKREKKPYC